MEKYSRLLALKAISAREEREIKLVNKAHRAKKSGDFFEARKKMAEERRKERVVEQTAEMRDNKSMIFAKAVRATNLAHTLGEMRRVIRHPDPTHGGQIGVPKLPLHSLSRVDRLDPESSSPLASPPRMTEGEIRAERKAKQDREKIWVAINEKEVEDGRRAVASKRESKRREVQRQRQALDAQVNVKRENVALIKEEEVRLGEFFKKLALDEDQEKRDDEARRLAAGLAERNRVRLELVAVEKKKRGEVVKRVQEELLEVKRAQDLIALDRVRSEAKAEKEKARQFQLKIENDKLQALRRERRAKEVAEELALEKEYEAKLDREDAARRKALEDTYAHQEQVVGVGMTAQQLMHQKMVEDEARAMRAQMEFARQEATAAAEKSRRQAEANKLQMEFLIQQRRIKDDEAVRERNELRRLARVAQIAAAEQERKELAEKEQTKERRYAHAMLVKEQIRQRKLDTLQSDPDLSTAELLINAPIIRAIDPVFVEVNKLTRDARGGPGHRTSGELSKLKKADAAKIRQIVN